MPALTFDEFDPQKLKDAETAIRGHEGGGPGVVSPQGAQGSGQIMPGTFRQYAHPGERIGNPKDNIEVSNRILRQSYQKYGGDVPRMATDYFSGAGNVAPPGSPTAWKQNRRDVNEPVSAYVANVQSRMPKRQPMTFDEFKPTANSKAMTFDEFKPMGPPQQGSPQLRSGPGRSPSGPGLSTTPGQAAGAEAAAMQDTKVAAAAQWIKQNYPGLQIKDMMGDLTNWAVGKGQDILESAFTKAGVPNPGRAARDLTQYLNEFLPLQGGIGKMGFKPPDVPGARAAGAGQAAVANALGSPGTGVPHIPGAAPTPNALGQSLTARPAPAGAHAVGAQVTPSGPQFTVPPLPTKDYIRSEDDAFFRLRQSATADKDEFSHALNAIPKEIRENPALAQRLFESHEPGGPQLSPADQAIYDRFGKPLDQEESDLFREAQKIDEKAVLIQEKIDRLTTQLTNYKNNPKLSASGNQNKFDAIDKEIVRLKKQRDSITQFQDFDPEYMHRMRKGKSKEFDPWMGEGAEGHPAAGYKSSKTASQKSAVYHAIENQAGKREIVRISGDGLYNMKGQLLSREKRKPGDEFKINGEGWEVKRASTSEIEKATGDPDMYYKNFWAAKIKNIIQLRAVTRLVSEVNRIKATPEFDAYSVKARDGANVPDGWRKPDSPLFQSHYLAPHLADVIDDFWNPGKNQWLPSLGKINRFLVTSLFLSPIPHATNAGVHWATARGWAWTTPKGYLSLAVDGAKAVHQVYTRGPEYQRMLREGSGLVYGSVANVDFYKTMLARLGEQVKKETPQWEKVANIMGLGTPYLIKQMYNISNRLLWLTSDVFMMQHVMELQRKGMPIREAIAKAEKHIPNYRIPPQVMGSRLLAERLKDPTIFEFNRYHFGQFASYAHMAKDLVGKNATKAERWEAMGNVFITGVIMLAIWPLINKGIQKLTGRDDIELGPKGSLTLPRLAWDIVPLPYRKDIRSGVTKAMQASIGPDWAAAVNDFWGKTDGQKDVGALISQSLMLAPVPRMALEETFNNDLFTGGHIREPGDEQKGRVARTLAQTAEHAAGFVSPYGALSRGAFAAKHPVGGLGELAKQSLGLRTVPKVYHGKSGGHDAAKNAAYRHAHPRGFIEDLERRAEKYKGTQ